MIQKVILNNATLPVNCYGEKYITYQVDLSKVKYMFAYQEYSKSGEDESLWFMIRHKFIYLQKKKDGKIIRSKREQFTGKIPMSFSIKCKTYCSDCGICAW